MPTPRSRRRFTTTIRRRTSASASAAVGSSMMRTRAFWESALAISTRWRLATERVPTLASTSRSWLSRLSRSWRDAAAHLRPVEAAEAEGGGVAEEDVLGDGELGEEQELLVDGGDAALDRVARGDGGELALADADAAAVGGVHAGDDLDERRLAGAVLAEERVHLAGEDVEVDVLEDADAGEGLRDAGERDEGGHLAPRPAAGGRSRMLQRCSSPVAGRVRAFGRLDPARGRIPPRIRPSRNSFFRDGAEFFAGALPVARDAAEGGDHVRDVSTMSSSARGPRAACSPTG